MISTPIIIGLPIRYVCAAALSTFILPCVLFARETSPPAARFLDPFGGWGNPSMERIGTGLPRLEAPVAVPFDSSGVRPGPVTVTSTAQTVTIRWADEAQRLWTAEFSLKPESALIKAIAVNGSTVIAQAQPYYLTTVGKRHGGWDAFFDFPPSDPAGTRTFHGKFTLKSARASTIGDRVEIIFDGLQMGIFQGSIHYVIFPHSRLIEQVAVVSTSEPGTAYFYDAGLSMGINANRDTGAGSLVSYYDTAGTLRDIASDTDLERQSLAVRYRTIAARAGTGSVAVFPAPHQYFFPRDVTTNLGYVWHSSGNGLVSLGIRQYPDDGHPVYPWSNAPPGTEQRLSMFLLVEPGDVHAALVNVAKFTHFDRFPALDGYSTFTSHWHFGYTVQAMEKGLHWTPPFKTVFEALGVNSALILDFHGDGHPGDSGETRLRELRAYYDACRAQSGPEFLLIPGEEANVYLGGHYALAFPKPVLWHMKRGTSQPFQETDPKHGTVYNVSDANELLDLVRKENGFVYSTHPRTKGSTGFPDQIKDSAQFLDPHYFGAGWKALPSDLSSPRLGDRVFKLLDDMSNWGLKKRILGEVDVFQIDSTHELYAHMNINYVRIPALPTFDNYGQLLDAIRQGDFFVSTGEVLLPEVKIAAAPLGRISVHARIKNTFPLQMAEVVWGDESQTHSKIIPLTETHEFGDLQFSTEVDAGNWKWARFAVWDVAANGAFVNPVWREK
jgi:hypothetical protein